MPIASRTKTFVQASLWVSAVAVGLAAVGFAKLIEHAQGVYFHVFGAHPVVMSLVTPLLFVAAAGVVILLESQAKGSGIPQVLASIHYAEHDRHHRAFESGLISIRAAWVKVLSAALGILGGASIGREGPTVQVAASLFGWVGRHVKARVPQADFSAFLVAGGAAGVAAAFNTPLAGVSFALEEVAEGAFTGFKQAVMISVIFAGITAQWLVGNYLYFGHPSVMDPTFSTVGEAVLIGLAGGCVGGAFAKVLSKPSLLRLPAKWWLKALICGLVCSVIGFLTHGETAGSGYEITRHFMDAQGQDIPPGFFAAKWVTTVFSYFSGMGGGIFAPTLSIGAGLGAAVGKLGHFVDLRTCALLGMVAVFTGAVQAPLTAVIIVMEMTDRHSLIFPMMVAAFFAQGVAKLWMTQSLYRYLSTGFRPAEVAPVKQKAEGSSP